MKLLKVGIGLLLATALVAVAYYTGKAQREWEIIGNIARMGEPDLFVPVIGRPESFFE
jgi:hypothetical protein